MEWNDLSTEDQKALESVDDQWHEGDLSYFPFANLEDMGLVKCSFRGEMGMKVTLTDKGLDVLNCDR